MRTLLALVMFQASTGCSLVGDELSLSEFRVETIELAYQPAMSSFEVKLHRAQGAPCSALSSDVHATVNGASLAWIDDGSPQLVRDGTVCPSVTFGGTAALLSSSDVAPEIRMEDETHVIRFRLREPATPRTLVSESDNIASAPGETFALAWEPGSDRLFDDVATAVLTSSSSSAVATTVVDGATIRVSIPADAAVGSYQFLLTHAGVASSTECVGVSECRFIVGVTFEAPVSIVR